MSGLLERKLPPDMLQPLRAAYGSADRLRVFERHRQTPLAARERGDPFERAKRIAEKRNFGHMFADA